MNAYQNTKPCDVETCTVGGAQPLKLLLGVNNLPRWGTSRRYPPRQRNGMSTTFHSFWRFLLDNKLECACLVNLATLI